MSLPRYQFAHGNSEHISIGTLNAVGYDTTNNTIKFKNDQRQYNQKCKLEPITKISQVFPNTFFKQYQTPLKSFQAHIDRMKSYYSVNYYDSQVDLDLLDSHLLNELKRNQKELYYDRFAGNKLHLYDNQTQLACVRGKSMNKLALYEVNELHNYVHLPTRTIGSATFQTPIHHITSFKPHYQTKQLSSHQDKLQLEYTTKLFNSEPMHVATNPYLSSKAAIVLDDGSIHLWDLSTDSVIEWMESDMIKSESEPYNWKSCQYGSHPQSLIIAKPNDISIHDLRMNPYSTTSIYSVQDTSFITDFKLNPTQAFQIGFVTYNHTSLIDIRYPTSPLLEWELNDSYEHQNHIEFLPSPLNPSDTSTFYTWGRYFTDIVTYSYHQGDAQPPTCTNIQQIPSYYHHPTIKHRPSDLIPSQYMEPIGFTQNLLENIRNPLWCPLIGSQFKQSEQVTTVYHLNYEGALYAQSFTYKNLDETEVSVAAKIVDDIEVWVTDKVRKLAKCSLPKNHLADHEILDFKPILKFCNDTIDRNKDKYLDLDTLKIPELTDTAISMYEMLTYGNESAIQYTDNMYPILPTINNFQQLQTQQLHHLITTSNPNHQFLELSTPPTITEYLNSVQPVPELNPSSTNSTFDYAKQLIEQDLHYSNQIYLPNSDHLEIIDDTTITNHKSILKTSILKSPIELEGITSWLRTQWNQEILPYTSEGESMYETDDGIFKSTLDTQTASQLLSSSQIITSQQIKSQTLNLKSATMVHSNPSQFSQFSQFSSPFTASAQQLSQRFSNALHSQSESQSQPAKKKRKKGF
ncbi:hypothetical protein HDV02_005068 [Globomyces sp. JEL0801]|nr:hypothetical protein HDV02_005068 [Globomyces sp. JEL0801]